MVSGGLGCAAASGTSMLRPRASSPRRWARILRSRSPLRACQSGPRSVNLASRLASRCQIMTRTDRPTAGPCPVAADAPRQTVSRSTAGRAAAPRRGRPAACAATGLLTARGDHLHHQFHPSRRFSDLAAGFGIGTATACRYVDEVPALLAARAPKLRKAVRDAKEAGHVYVGLDGTLSRSTASPATSRSTPASTRSTA